MTAIEREVAKLPRLPVPKLWERYAEAFGESTRTANKAWLVKRIAWRLRAMNEDDLSKRVRRRAADLANDADLRLNPPKPKVVPERAEADMLPATAHPRLPPAGSILTRPYKGDVVKVRILATGFEYAGDTYASLSALAKTVTGSHCNGFLFFKLTGGAARCPPADRRRSPSRRTPASSGAPCTPACRPRTGWTRNSTRSMPRGRPARRTSPASESAG